MTESTHPPKVAKLSDMEVDKTYTITADGVDASLYVLTAGSSPVCIVDGGLGDKFDSQDNGVAVLQLIGWALFAGYTMSSTGFTMFVTDEQPEMAYLVGVWMRGGAAETFIVATGPTITPKS